MGSAGWVGVGSGMRGKEALGLGRLLDRGGLVRLHRVEDVDRPGVLLLAFLLLN